MMLCALLGVLPPSARGQTAHTSLAAAAAVAPYILDDNAALSEAQLRAVYDGGRAELPVRAGPSRLHRTLNPAGPGASAPAGRPPLPAPAASPPEEPGLTRTAVRCAVGPFKAVLDLAWRGSWGGMVWLRETVTAPAGGTASRGTAAS